MTPEPAVKVDVYRLESEQSRFTVQAFSQGLFSAFGHDPVILIKEFTGELQFKPSSYEAAKLSINVDPNSLVVGNDVKEKDRLDIERTMREEVLETAKFPEIIFSSSNISVNKLTGERCRARIIGDLTLHGVMQKNIWISSEATVTADGLRASGEFSLKQSDFGIKPYSAAGGTIKLKNELKFSFDMVGKKQ